VIPLVVEYLRARGQSRRNVAAAPSPGPGDQPTTHAQPVRRGHHGER
jgi:hypothetical protein